MKAKAEREAGTKSPKKFEFYPEGDGKQMKVSGSEDIKKID